VRLIRVKSAFARTYADVLRNHTLQMAAALSYYFVLSLFPSLIFLSAVLAYLPVPNVAFIHYCRVSLPCVVGKVVESCIAGK
jgi:membrane protein